MKLAIMQPYFFPYIGYFQLIHSVDLFVVYDNVQYRKGGWINRNRILVNGSDKYITIPLKNNGYTANINERLIHEQRWERERVKLLRTLEQSYKKSPLFVDVFPVIIQSLMHENFSLVDFVFNSIKACCSYLQIDTKFVFSSSLNECNDVGGQDRVIALCKYFNANHYINLSGGMELYDKAVFLKNKIDLSFLKSGDIRYRQFGCDFVPSLSIIDVMMFNRLDEIKGFIHQFELI